MAASEAPLIDFLLLGGGLASATVAETLRAAGAEGSVAILSAENTLPYYRPPLSKTFLLEDCRRGLSHVGHTHHPRTR
jgi:NTE family protein